MAWKDNECLKGQRDVALAAGQESEEQLKKFQAQFLIIDSQLDFANFKYGEELELHKRTQKKLNKVTLNRNKCLHKIDQLHREGLDDHFVEEVIFPLNQLLQENKAVVNDNEVIKALSQREQML